MDIAPHNAVISHDRMPSCEVNVGHYGSSPKEVQQPGSVDEQEGLKKGIYETTTQVSGEDSVPIEPPTSPPPEQRPRKGLALQILGDWVWEIWFCFISVASFTSKLAATLPATKP